LIVVLKDLNAGGNMEAANINQSGDLLARVRATMTNLARRAKEAEAAANQAQQSAAAMTAENQKLAQRAEGAEREAARLRLLIPSEQVLRELSMLEKMMGVAPQAQQAQPAPAAPAQQQAPVIGNAAAEAAN
jgi:hypothetical protein